MEIRTATSGSYPRIGEESHQMRVRKAYNDHKKGEISNKELEEICNSYTKEIMREQEEIGIDIITDGMIKWYDSISHFGKTIEGCKINGLKRFFDTNFYYRQPVVKGKIRKNKEFLADDFRNFQNFTDKTLKPVLTGSYTFATHSINDYYEKEINLIRDYSKLLEEEVKLLSEIGARYIQIDEPSLLCLDSNWGDVIKFYEDIYQNMGKSDLWIQFYFGDCTRHYQKIQNFPADVVNLDFLYSDNLIEKIKEKGTKKKLGLGMINSRNTKLEGEKHISSKLLDIISNIDSNKLFLTPNTGLEYLPRDKAYKKLENMERISQRCRERENE